LFPDIRGHSTQVLANDCGPLPDALQGHNFQHFSGGIADICSLGRAGPPGNPKEAKEAHNVINPQGAAARAILAQHLDKIAVALGSQLVRQQGGQTPILTQGTEVIRGRPDINSQGKEVLVRPGIKAAGIHPYGKVKIESQRQIPVFSLGRRCLKLIGQQPLRVHMAQELALMAMGKS
jgi:hypothetical protein